MVDTLPTYPPSVPADFKAGHTPTPEQEQILQNLLKRFTASNYELPGAEEGKEALMDEEKFWLSYECLLRYLRASKWSDQIAMQRVENTLRWRREFGLYDKITAEHVEPEALTGKLVLYGYDVQRRPGFYMNPSRQNTEESMRQIEFTVFVLERITDLMGPGVETLVILLDYANKAKNPSLGQAKRVLDIIQNHYPERLGKALVLNVPWVLNTFFKLISPFIDPVTRPKLIFNPKAVEDGHFAANQITTTWGGEKTFEWKHELYWPALVKMCEEQRSAWFKKWKELGGTAGLRECDFKAGVTRCTN